MTVPLRVAVMGCVVNGPGEAREADLGVASGNGKGQIFVKGEVVKTVPESQIVETLIEEAMRLAEQALEVDGHDAPGQPIVTVSDNPHLDLDPHLDNDLANPPGERRMGLCREECVVCDPDSPPRSGESMAMVIGYVAVVPLLATGLIGRNAAFDHGTGGPPV